MHLNLWTLAFQTVNVLILIWVLARFFFRPLAEIVDKRQRETTKLLADAAAARQEARELRTVALKMREEIAAERDRLLGEARKAAQEEKARELALSNEEVAKQRREAEGVIARERLAAERAFSARASELSIDIARRLLRRLPAGVSFAAFCAGLGEELRALPADSKLKLATSDADHPVEIVSAERLNEDQAQDARATLRREIGGEPLLVFREDPTLIAGVEIRSRNLIVRNNWKADVEAIRQEMSRD